MDVRQTDAAPRAEDGAPQSTELAVGTVVVVTVLPYRGASVRVEPPDQPWQYAPVVWHERDGVERCTAVVNGVPAGTCWVHLEGADHQNERSAQVTVAAGGVVELDWEDDATVGRHR